MDPKKTICTIPWNHVAVMQNGDYGICCQCIYSAAGRLITDGNAERVDDKDVDDIRNHPMYVDLRHSLINGRQHPLCKLCWDEESFGKRSKRLNQTELYTGLVEKILNHPDKSGRIDTKEFPVTYIDLRLGNLCNLACRSCGPNDSSLWQDFMEGGSFQVSDDGKRYDIVKVGSSWRIDSEDFQYYKSPGFRKLLEKVLPTTDRIYFTGGEPLINKRHYEILDFCIENNLAKNITIEYNTNGTTLNPALLEQWNHFKKVDVCFSIDAMGPLANYVRYPSDWNTIESNMRLVSNSGIPHLTGTSNCTVSILNVMHFPEFFTWYYEQEFKNFKRNLGWNRLVFPIYLNVQIIPKYAKEQITRYYDNFINQSQVPDIHKNIYSIITYMNQADREKKFLFRSLLATSKQDKLRDQKLRDHVPWLADVFNKEFING